MTKKLLYLANIRIPTEKAHGVQIMQMCEAFADAGLAVELWVPRRVNKIKTDAFQYYSVKENFRINYLPGIDFLRWDNILGPVAFWLQSVAFLLTAKLRLFGQSGEVIIYSRNDLAGLFFKKFIFEAHFLSKKVGWWQKFLWSRAKKIIAITQLLKQRFVAAGVPADKILVAPDGVNASKFHSNINKIEARQKVGLPENKEIIMYMGSFYLYDWKGVEIFLESIKSLDPNFLFVLVGGRQSEIEAIRQHYPGGNILLVAKQPYATIPFYLAAADMLVLPNKTGQPESDEYTSPLKLFEYMAVGRPIVASDLLSIGEILNNKNAILVEPNNPVALAEGIKNMAQDQNLAGQLSGQALKDVQNFTWQRRVEKIVKFIEHDFK